MDIFTAMEGPPLIKKREGFTGERACILPIALKEQLQAISLCRNLYLTDIGYYPKALYHNRERKQGCRQFILIYCMYGSGWFAAKGDRHAVKANQFFILPEDTPHAYGSDPDNPWSIYWIHFTGALAAEYFDYLMGKGNLQPRMVFPSEERNQLFDEIISYGSMINNLDSVIYANNCLYNYLASFKNSIFSNSDEDKQKTTLIERCIKLMKENLDKNMNLFEIAQLMDVSISHLSALFKERMHDSPYNYYLFLKVQRACYLLWNTELPVKAIAGELGYEDPYHFSRVFKNTMGLSPKAFRNREH